MIGSFTIVDGHVHTFSSKEVSLKVLQSFNKIYNIEFENPGTGTIDDVLSKMESEGIDYTVMANFASTKILHANNKWTLEESRKHPNLIPLVSFHPDMEASFTGLLHEYISEGAKGIKLHPMAQGFDPKDKRLEGVYEHCNDIAFPIVFHCGRVANARLNSFSDVETLEPLIARYENIPFVLTHMADGNVDDVLRLAQYYKNVYFDTSIVISGYPPIRETNEPSWLDDSIPIGVINEIGAERLIFGSDYPWGSPAWDLKRFMAMKLDDDQKKIILGENAVKLFLNRTYN
ncbi:MAG TPA: amidohydrolase family protein [Acetivibrio sp.]|uniref:amidohydrolase family protein n=1 Tax=Acetivibrio sp. TaxID=1872092 RepID=UPI002C3BA14E|nr:amidohydrolase family protein [Acetivibrio sp.]HOM02387.1 amidohydrolase family protein [Acetivibrio sp.]